ncbi:patatin-like phospholipase family protein [Collinsella vaginalis]|uniref:patatin-like phospholipase family protein n=1 Tax=Collinsella vaginalis TaxID=1870987 RepID=UPI000A270B84|nr:patatin family protein [Collinsella vaginalis]
MGTAQSTTTAPQGSSTPKTALILEGGSFRGQFTAGVLDIFLERGITFDACFGVSAGTLNGLSFKSRQIGRASRINLAFCNDPRYIGARSLFTSGSIVGYDFMFNDIQNVLDPFDNEAFRTNPMRLFATVTNVLFGTAEYLEVSDTPRDLDIVRASTSLPLVTPPVQIGANRYLDGGVADSVPVEHALEEAGYDRAVVVLTQHRAYDKEPYEFMAAARARYSSLPYLLEALSTRNKRYNEQRAHIWSYEEQGKALVLAPETPVEVGHIEHDATKLLDLYIQGRQAAERQLDEIAAFTAGHDLDGSQA